MSSDIVKQLRLVPSLIRTEAADTIEALEGEVERLEGEVAALTEARDAAVRTIQAYMDEATKREARAERLRVALEEFRNFARDCLPHTPALAARIDLASTALEDDKQ